MEYTITHLAKLSEKEIEQVISVFIKNKYGFEPETFEWNTDSDGCVELEALRDDTKEHQYASANSE